MKKDYIMPASEEVRLHGCRLMDSLTGSEEQGGGGGMDAPVRHYSPVR